MVFSLSNLEQILITFLYTLSLFSHLYLSKTSRAQVLPPFKPSSLVTFLRPNPLLFPVSAIPDRLHKPPEPLSRTMNVGSERGRKRKGEFENNSTDRNSQQSGSEGGDDDDFLALSLSSRPLKPRKDSLPSPPPPPPPPPKASPDAHSLPSMVMYESPALVHEPTMVMYSPPVMLHEPSLGAVLSNTHQEALPHVLSHGGRRKLPQTVRDGKSETVPVPFPWATNRRATVHSMNYLLSNRIFTITGEVQCKKCEKVFEIEYDLRGKFLEVGNFIAQNKATMHDRAPHEWMSPVLPKCRFCNQENSAKPVISAKKKKINWLFLLLGQTLGCLTLKQLKYFCAHTKIHRTGAKDRILYYTYLGLCKQLDPTGPFDISR
ncbi:uncharacterized protein LOC104420542 [Eucalyptus grandis]|uniref:uncharacterized protein LOC104420542 n=1 Tax=Eucalyptus grandis TaxID=71139 RepID=UPI00192EE942|nr:uncharacterized protein LOC104420542 [Eucalyptus grandis]